MSQPVVIENELVQVQIWPHLGGKVSSVIDKADKFDLLFSYPTEIPTEPKYDSPYGDSWYAGWDECFPAVARSSYIGHPYDNLMVPDHGELWGLPTVAVPTKGGISTVWHGLRFGYRLTRNLVLDGSDLIAEYQLANLAPFDFHFVWAQHALLGSTVPVELHLPAGIPMRYSHDAQQKDVQQGFEWPSLDGDTDFSCLANLPPKAGWKLFSLQPIFDSMRIVYPGRSRSLSIKYTSADIPAYWGIWINTGGWAGHRHFAVEPTIGRFDQLDRSVRDGSAGTVKASGSVTWTVHWTVGAC